MIITAANESAVTVYTEFLDEKFIKDLIDKCGDYTLHGDPLIKIGICKSQFSRDMIQITSSETRFIIDERKSVIKYPHISPIIHISFMVKLYKILERN
mgnify:CR=1 FL=1